MFGFSLKISLQEHFTNIAKGKYKAKIKDFELNKDGQSLIHIASQYDNLELFQKCIAKGFSIETPDFWNETPIKYAVEGHSISILDFINKNSSINLNERKDCYGQPLWWGSFTSRSRERKFDGGSTYYSNNYLSKDYDKMFEYLQDKVDFSQSHNERNISTNLLLSKNFKALQSFCNNKKCTGSDLSDIGFLSNGLFFDNYFTTFSSKKFESKDEERAITDCINYLMKTTDVSDTLGLEFIERTLTSKSSSTIMIKLLIKYHFSSLRDEDKLFIINNNYQRLVA